MKIQNKRSEAVSTVSAETWERMKKKGMAQNYTILEGGTSVEEAAQPEEVQKVDLSAILEKAALAFKAGKLFEAKGLYEDALKIKDTTHTQRKLSKVKKAIEDAKENEVKDESLM